MKKQDMAVQEVRIGGRAYWVRTQIVVEEIDGDDALAEADGEVRRVGDGEFEMVLSDADACSIDKSEQAVLETTWPAMREALSQHLSAVSKKNRRRAEWPWWQRRRRSNSVSSRWRGRPFHIQMSSR